MSRSEPRGPALPVSIITIILICVAVEATFQLADNGIIAGTGLRPLGYQYAGFWAGLLYDWQPNYAGQSLIMFMTYAFLHGGFWHLLFNMITLASLSALLSSRICEWRLVLLYAASIIGGAVVFGLLSRATQPMVGASGGLFGLIGAYAVWNAEDRLSQGSPLHPVLRLLIYLMLFNVISWWLTDGQLAWQTHLGGFLVGAAFAAFEIRFAQQR